MTSEPNNPALHAGVEPKKPRSAVRVFVIGGLAGGTVLVVVASFAFDDWSFLTRWFTGLAAVAIVFVYIFGKKWLVGRAVRLAQQNGESDSLKRETDA